MMLRNNNKSINSYTVQHASQGFRVKAGCVAIVDFIVDLGSKTPGVRNTNTFASRATIQMTYIFHTPFELTGRCITV